MSVIRFLFVTMLASISCATGQSEKWISAEWRIDDANVRALEEVNKYVIEKKIIKEIQSDFSRNPYIQRITDNSDNLIIFSALALDRVYKNKEATQQYYVFEIVGVSDVYAVYAFDEKRDFIRNFLWSPFLATK